MRVVIQRVKKASVSANNNHFESIGNGLLVFLGIELKDDETDIDWLTKKIVSLRIFDDEEGVMNLSLQDIQGDILLVSQFTLHAKTKKGNRPSYIEAAPAEISEPLYNQFGQKLENLLQKKIFRGRFGAYMAVELINDGPVTIIIDSKNRS